MHCGGLLVGEDDGVLLSANTREYKGGRDEGGEEARGEHVSGCEERLGSLRLPGYLWYIEYLYLFIASNLALILVNRFCHL